MNVKLDDLLCSCGDMNVIVYFVLKLGCSGVRFGTCLSR
jgi:hypothetical protein